MNDTRTAGILGVVMGAVFVLGIMYLTFGERVGIKSQARMRAFPSKPR